MLEGGKVEGGNSLPTELRDWQLAKRFGWTFDEIREAPAVWLDWLLRIDGIAAELAHKREA